MDQQQLDGEVREPEQESQSQLTDSRERMCEAHEEANENFVLGYN